MSHEGIRAFDHRTDEEINRDKKQRYYEKASRQLYDEGEIGFCGTRDDFWRKERKINSRARELQERDEYQRLKKKYE